MRKFGLGMNCWLAKRNLGDRRKFGLTRWRETTAKAQTVLEVSQHEKTTKWQEELVFVVGTTSTRGGCLHYGFGGGQNSSYL